MKRKFFFTFPLSLLMTLTVHAALLDDFDGYAEGSDLHGQGNWIGWDNVPTVGALVSSDYSFSPGQSANISGNSDLVHNFSGISSGQWSFSIMQYVPSTSTGNSYLILLNQYTDGGPYNWSVQIQSNIDTGLVISDNGASAQLPLIRDAWVEYRFEIDLDSNTVDEFYNNQFLSSHAWQDGTGLNALAALDLYANGAASVYYDNLGLEDASQSVRFEILSIDYDDEAVSATITWSAKNGRTYAIDYSDNLALGEWMEIANNEIAQSDTASFTDTSLPVEGGKRFYRVRQLP